MKKISLLPVFVIALSGCQWAPKEAIVIDDSVLAPVDQHHIYVNGDEGFITPGGQADAEKDGVVCTIIQCTDKSKKQYIKREMKWVVTNSGFPGNSQYLLYPLLQQVLETGAQFCAASPRVIDVTGATYTFVDDTVLDLTTMRDTLNHPQFGPGTYIRESFFRGEVFNHPSNIAPRPAACD